MNILITAGGTTEKIDDVRSITNMGTGTLGSLIADEFAQSDFVETIYYICGEKSVRPGTAKAEIFPIGDTQSLAETVEEICTSRKVDAVIHSMAVSDYRVKSVTTADSLASWIREGTSAESSRIKTFPDLRTGGKLSSNIEDMMILLEKTPKIISMFRGWSPEAVIVGFKLLSDVPTEILIETAYELLRKNDCDFVLANDMKTVNTGNHIGYLIDREKNHCTLEGKSSIATGIVQAVIEKITGENA